MENNKKNLLFVSGNINKIKDAGVHLPGYNIKGAGIEVPEIQDVNVINVVKAKLKSAFEQTKQPCFVMDASLVINGLCKEGEEKIFPGALIKDVYENMGDKKIAEFVNLSKDTRALFKAVVGYYDGENEHYFEESVKLNIASEPRGTNGFDWDTIVIPEGESKTFAEMTYEEKQRYTLTGRLYGQFSEFLGKGIKY